MARADFKHFQGDLTEEDLNTLLKIAKKKRTFWFFCWIGTIVAWLVLAIVLDLLHVNISVPILPWIALPLVALFAGFGTYTHNVCCYVSSRGYKDGGGFISGIWAFIGGLVIGGIVAYICNRLFPISILGWRKTGISFNNRRW